MALREEFLDWFPVLDSYFAFHIGPPQIHRRRLKSKACASTIGITRGLFVMHISHVTPLKIGRDYNRYWKTTTGRLSMNGESMYLPLGPSL